MKNIIRNLLAEPDPSRRICTIIRPLPGGRYQLRDELNRILTAEPQAGQSWQAGQVVIVSAGRIIRSAGRNKRPNVTEV